MTTEPTQVKLPALSSRESDPVFAAEVAELAALLKQTAINWAINRAEKPMALSIGAAFFAALWAVSESARPDNQRKMREAHLHTLLKNDESAALLLLPHPGVDSSPLN